MLYKKTRKPSFKFKYKATEILYDKMMFYHTKATEIAEYLIKIVENNQQARGDLLVVLHKDLHKFNNIVIECASKLAPYQAPKLQSLELKSTHTHRFVVAAPKVIQDTQEWLDTSKREQVIKQITKPITFDNTKNIIDIEANAQ